MDWIEGGNRAFPLCGALTSRGRKRSISEYRICTLKEMKYIGVHRRLPCPYKCKQTTASFSPLSLGPSVNMNPSNTLANGICSSQFRGAIAQLSGIKPKSIQPTETPSRGSGDHDKDDFVSREHIAGNHYIREREMPTRFRVQPSPLREFGRGHGPEVALAHQETSHRLNAF